MIEHDLVPEPCSPVRISRSSSDPDPSHPLASLDDSLVRHKFDLPSGNMAAKERERASWFATDLRGPGSRRHAPLHGRTQLHDLAKLFRVRERFVDAFPARLEDRFEMNRFRRMRNRFLGSRQALVEPKTRPPNAAARPTIACRRVGALISAARLFLSLIIPSSF